MLTLRTAALLLLQGITIPAPTGYVNDFARVIDAGTKTRIEAIVKDVQAKSKGEIVVVTLPDLGGRAIEDVGLQIGREWKIGADGAIGSQGRNAGAIIILVPKETSGDGHVHGRIEVGSGAEGFLTDATVGAILDEAGPYVQRGDYGGAIELMTGRVAERYATEFNFTLEPNSVPPEPVQRQRARGNVRGINPVVLFIIFIVIVSMLGGNRRRRGCLPIFIPMGGGGWGGGGGGFGGGGFGGGGFGGFGGGGGFSGGGSSRSW
jgi:uncharacterized protein